MNLPRIAADAPLFLVLNTGSGKGAANDALAALRHACAHAGRGLSTFPIDRRHRPETQARAAVAAARAAGGIVVVAGGDGTINTVAEATLGSGCAFGVLPQGTFNYFARNHGIPTDTAGAVAALLRNPAEDLCAVQVGQVNQRVFLVNASLGLYARLLEDREVYKARFGRNRLVALAAALRTLVQQHRPWNLRLAWRGEMLVRRTASLFVGNNALQFEQVGVAEGEALQAGELAAVLVEPMGRLARLGLLLRGAASRLDAAEKVETLSFRSLHVEPAAGARSRRVKVAADGEVRWMQMPLHFRVAAEPLWLIKPPASSPAAAKTGNAPEAQTEPARAMA